MSISLSFPLSLLQSHFLWIFPHIFSLPRLFDSHLQHFSLFWFGSFYLTLPISQTLPLTISLSSSLSSPNILSQFCFWCLVHPSRASSFSLLILLSLSYRSLAMCILSFSLASSFSLLILLSLSYRSLAIRIFSLSSSLLPSLSVPPPTSLFLFFLPFPLFYSLSSCASLSFFYPEFL